MTRMLFLSSTLLLLVCTIKAQPYIALQATGYDSHVQLDWPAPSGTAPAQYRIYRAENGGAYQIAGTQSTRSKLDFRGPVTTNYSYYVSALSPIGVVLGNSDTIEVAMSPKDDNALFDMVQSYTFKYFWDFGHPTSGMARERNTSGDVVTTGGTGFGVMSILVAIERGFITREQGRDRLLQITGFLDFADKFHGAFPHWMNGNTGNVVPFSQYDNGGDLVETAFLIQGLLAARSYFDGTDALETALRSSITQIWEDVEWDWYRKNNSNVLYWHWSPNYGWQMNFQLRGFNETMIVYLLAIASPTHGVPASLYTSGWAAQNYVSGLSWYGQTLAVGPPLGGPLFFAHYSYLGFDPRNKKDAYCNYFDRNQAHTLINRAFCIANPLNHTGYAENCWGLTACDGPTGYFAHEPLGVADKGTIAPTAALSSMPYTATESIEALKHFYRTLGDKIWGPMGFYDAFNETENWYADSYLAIDQGPIIVMIENYRSGLLWDLFMANPEIQPMLDAVGFVPDVNTTQQPSMTTTLLSPNPSKGLVQIQGANSDTEIEVYSTLGKKIWSGKGTAFSTAQWPSATYFVRVTQQKQTRVQQLLVE